MPSLRVFPKNAVVHLEAGDYGASLSQAEKNDELVFEPTFTQVFSYEVDQKGDFDSVRLTTGEEFSELEGRIFIRRSTEENNNKAVGRLTYVPEYVGDLEGQASSYQINCELPARQFDELLSAARQGRVPSEISISVVGEGAKYGWEPDGSGFDWDNKENRHLLVAHIGFYLPYVFPTDSDDLDREGEAFAGTAPASQSQLERLLRKTDALRKNVRGLGWIIAIATIFLAAINGGWFK